MIPAILILLASTAPAGAQSTAQVSARIIAGERIALSEPVRDTDRQLTEAVRRFEPGGEPVKLRLVEFQ